MQYRIDNKTGNKLSILGFGCMRLPGRRGRIDIDKTEKLFIEAINNGVNYFDTAYFYPGSEEAIGQIFEKNNLRDKVFIATKLPFYLCRSYFDFNKYFNIQLERLKTNYIDYYFIHMLNSYEQWKQLCELGLEKWIAEKKAQGKIKQIGFSFHGERDSFITLLDSYDWDFCQIQYNYVNINYQAGIKGLKYAASKDIPVFIMEPLLGGRLVTGLPAKAVNLFKEANSTLSPAAWALRWVWNQEEVTVVLSGMNELSQLNENITIAETATKNMLSEKELETINKVIGVFNDSYKISCTGCGYCMPCPKNVDIPGCFATYNTSYSINKFAGIKQYIITTGAMFSPQGSASTCVKCGECEKHCPQNIPIRDSLEAVCKRMEPFWYKVSMAVVRSFTKRKDH